MQLYHIFIGKSILLSAAYIQKGEIMEIPKVYFTKQITSESLIKIFEALGRELKGRVAVKISTGEPGGHNFLNPNLIN